MTRDEKIQAAWWLHADYGYRHAALGAVLGVTGSCVTRWLNPERTARWVAAQNARRGPAKRAWEREHDRHPCPCGALRSVGAHRGNPNGLCDTCARDAQAIGRAMRMQPIYEMWTHGDSLTAIATSLGMRVGTVGFHITTMRREGWDMPYRHNYPVRVTA